MRRTAGDAVTDASRPARVLIADPAERGGSRIGCLRAGVHRVGAVVTPPYVSR